MNTTKSDPVKIDLEQLLREGNIIRIKPQGYSMITSDGFYMVGDNQYEVEGPLRQDQIIGKLIAVNRSGKEFTVGNPFYKFVSSLWLFMLPVRPFCFKLSAFLRKLHHS